MRSRPRSPVIVRRSIYEIGGERQLIIWHSDAVVGLDPVTGEVLLVGAV